MGLSKQWTTLILKRCKIFCLDCPLRDSLVVFGIARTFMLSIFSSTVRLLGSQVEGAENRKCLHKGSPNASNCSLICLAG